LGATKLSNNRPLKLLTSNCFWQKVKFYRWIYKILLGKRYKVHVLHFLNNVNINKTKVLPCLVRLLFPCPKGDLLTQVWLYFMHEYRNASKTQRLSVSCSYGYQCIFFLDEIIDVLCKSLNYTCYHFIPL
jgi:hypothetical protein